MGRIAAMDARQTGGAMTTLAQPLAVATKLRQWAVCRTCGHMWKTRAHVGPPRCVRCEQRVRRAALDAARACAARVQP